MEKRSVLGQFTKQSTIKRERGVEPAEQAFGPASRVHKDKKGAKRRLTRNYKQISRRFNVRYGWQRRPVQTQSPIHSGFKRSQTRAERRERNEQHVQNKSLSLHVRARPAARAVRHRNEIPIE